MKRLLKGIAILLILSISIHFPATVSKAEEAPVLYVYYLAVGQADCILVKLGDKFMLIDTGGYYSSMRDTTDTNSVTLLNGETINAKTETNVKRFITKLLPKVDGKPYLDYLVITHYDSDHVGGLLHILGHNTPNDASDDIKVGTFLSRKYSTTTLNRMYLKYVDSGKDPYRNYLKMINAVAQDNGRSPVFDLSAFDKDATSFTAATTTSKLEALKSSLGVDYNWVFPAKDSTIEIYNDGTNSLSVKFFHKDTTYINANDEGTSEEAEKSYAGNINNDSLIFKLSYNTGTNSKHFMFLGDAVEDALKNLNLYDAATLKSNVVKITHHGFKLNATGRVIEETLYPKMNPTISIISNASHKIKKADGTYKKKRLVLFNNSYTNYLPDSDITNKYGTYVFETWAMQAYVDTANKNYNFVGLRMSTNGSYLYKHATYMNLDNMTTGSFGLVRTNLVKVLGVEELPSN